MRALLGFSIAVLIVTAAPTNAQTSSRTNCQTMVEPMKSVAAGMRTFYNSMQGADTSVAAKMFAGPEKDAFLKLEMLRQKILPLMKEYADQAEDTNYLIQKCAR